MKRKARRTCLLFTWLSLVLTGLVLTWQHLHVFGKHSETHGSDGAHSAGRLSRPWNCSDCFQWHYRVVADQTDVCLTRDGQTIDLVFLIPSAAAPAHRDSRDAVRRTWGSVTRNNTSNFRHVFLLGVSSDALLMRGVEEERRQFRDIVVLGVHDTYRNLTLKTLMTLRWLTESCPHAKLFMKVDDDMWLNLPLIMQQLKPLQHKLQTATAGYCHMSSRVLRDPSNKWSATLEEYPADHYPPYCSGTAYVSSPQVARQVVNVSRHVPYFHLEDAYVGLCLRQLQYGVHSVAGFHLDVPDAVGRDVCAVWSPEVLTVHMVTPPVLMSYWTAPCPHTPLSSLLVL